MCRIGAVAEKTAVGVLFHMPASISLLCKERETLGVRGHGEGPEGIIFFGSQAGGGSQARRRVRCIDGKQEMLVDDKLVCRVIPAEHILRAVDGGEDFSGNEFEVGSAFGQNVIMRNDLNL